MMKALATAAALVAALALLAFSAVGEHDSALAQGSPLVMGIDPETTGNTCAASLADGSGAAGPPYAAIAGAAAAALAIAAGAWYARRRWLR